MSLAIEQLHFRYNGTPVLDQIDLEVDAGELVMILGPNGVGKTTLLKCLNGIHRPKSGAVLVENRDVLRMKSRDVARIISYVPQRTEPVRLTVFDTVLLGRKPHIVWQPGKRDLKIVDAALKLLDLDELALRYADELSGGELQKVVIARALVQEPRLLLLDEPTSALDLKNQVQILSLIRRVVEQHNITAVMTMHDINSALRYGDRFCFLRDGNIYAFCDLSRLDASMIEAVYGVAVTLHQVAGRALVVPAE